jgi:hypothetical protein
MQGIFLAKRPATRLNEDILNKFKAEIDGICPPLGDVAISKDPCFEASVGYATALAKCEQEGHDEDECPEAWGYGGAAVMCTMQKIEDMMGRIREILERQVPPKPIPWPTEL